MYCTSCGVEIEDGIKRCPLCGSTALSSEPGFVPRVSEYEPLEVYVAETRISRIYRRTLTLVVATAIAVVAITDIFGTNAGVDWSPIAVLAIATGYVAALLPALRLGIYQIVVLDILSAGGLLLAIDLLQDGKIDWFVRVALPILGALGVVLVVSGWVIARVRGVAKPAVVLVAAAVLCTIIDLIVRGYADPAPGLAWSLIVLFSLLPAAIFLVLLQHTVLREIDLRRRLDL